MLRLSLFFSTTALTTLACIPTAFTQQSTNLPPITVTTPKAQGVVLERPSVVSQTPSTIPTSDPSGTDELGSRPDGVDTAAGVPINSIGTQVSVITRADLDRQQTRNPIDALRALPGVLVSSSGSVGGLTQIRIRGAEGRHTRVMIDGIEANTTTNGEFDFSNLLAEDIERIEVIRGPMSALYGSGALGGTINIITRKSSKPEASVRVEGGSFGTKDIAARVSTGNANGYLSGSAQFRRTEGVNISPEGNENDGTRIASFALSGGMKLSPTARLEMTVRHVDKRADLDETQSVVRLPFATADEALSTQRDKTTIAGLTLAWDGLGGALTQELKANYAASDVRYRALPLLGFGAGVINNSNTEGQRYASSYAATYRMDWPSIGLKHAITGLIDARHERFTPFSDYPTFFGDFNGDGLTRQRDQFGTGVEWRGTFNDRLSVTVGARHEWNETFANIETWRASMSYAIKEAGLRPHASIGKGAKLPGMYDLFGPNNQTYQSNPNLKAETSVGWDAGLEWSTWGGRALFDVTYFSHDLRDKITGFGGFDLTTFRSFTTNDPGIATRRGVEVSARIAMTAAWSLGLAYTYTDARQGDGSAEFRRSPHSGRAELRYGSPDGKLTASVAAAYAGTQLDRGFLFAPPFSQPTELGAYWLVTVAASYKLQQNLEIYGRVENALDANYQEIYGYNTPGIAAYVGMKLTFGPQ